jgi:hypothetical protein
LVLRQLIVPVVTEGGVYWGHQTGQDRVSETVGIPACLTQGGDKK